MFEEGKYFFRQEQEEQIKNIIKDIKMRYFDFLNSLKFENLDLKKTEKDFKISDPISNEELQPPAHLDIATLKDETLNFEDEMLAQNKGQAALLLMIDKIKELKNFNSNLKYQIIANSSKSTSSMHFSK